VAVQTSHELDKIKIIRPENYLDAIKYLKNERTIKKTQEMSKEVNSSEKIFSNTNF
jgi:hypothetical protein